MVSEHEVYPAIESWQNKIDEELQSRENGPVEALGQWQIATQEAIVANWWQMADFLIMKYNDARINRPTVGTATGYPQWYSDLVGFGQDVHPVWVQPAKHPSSVVVKQLSGYTPPTVKLP